MPTPSPDVVHTTLSSGEVVLLHLQKRKYYSLNVTGAHIWNLLMAGHSIDEIGQSLTEEFDVTFDHARASVSSLLDDMIAAGFLCHAAND